MLNWDERGSFLATCDDEVVYCRIVGVANMNNSAPFDIFTRAKSAQGYREFIVDFSDCEALDSTFLGILLALRIGGPAEGGRRPGVTAINVSPEIRATLAEVGLDRIIEVLPRPLPLPEIPMQRLESECTERERLDMVLGAHEVLCRVGDENSRRFGAFVSLLRGELSRAGRAGRRRAAAAEGSDG